MLIGRQQLRYFASAVALALLVCAALLIHPLSASANSCWIDEEGHQQCDIEIEQPGNPGSGDGTTGPVGFSPGPSTCVWNGGTFGGDLFGNGGTLYEAQEVPCSTGSNWWSNSQQCYWTLDDPQRPAPNGKSPNVGAYYYCAPYVPPGETSNAFLVSAWQDAPPPGISRYTPAQAAGMLVRTFTLEPITIGMAPESKVHSDDPIGTAAYRRTWVGIPVWLWVDGTSESTWGPLSRTATYGGVTVTATAGVRSLTWSSGDGQTINCGVGTPFNAAAMADQLAVDSPTCGFRYQRTSGSGTFTVSASTSWVVEWTGGGESGNIAMPMTTSTAQVRVGELQSVNTANYGD